MMYKLMFLSYMASALLYGGGIVSALKRKETAVSALRWFGLAALLVGLAVGIYVMTTSWIDTGHPPFQTLYQSLIFFSATTALVFLYAGRRILVMGVITAAFILAILAYGFLKKDVDSVELPPALQSAWFIPHVVVYFLGYSALFVSFVTSILYLIFPKAKELPSADLLGLDTLDFNVYSYKAILFGYAMISAGLILGALWAKFAWGDWWSWDPKENWALVTWLVYTAYLHFRFTKRFSKKGLAWISIIGFLAVMFTYLGVNYLPAAQEALHSYTME